VNIKHRIAILSVVLGFAGSEVFGQQLPIFTQFPSDQLYFNPAVAGTKRVYDIRLDYRDQWIGFPDAPVTEGISLNYRLLGGKMGVAGYMYEDKTGPTQRNDYTLCYAYHLKLPDLVVSLGLEGTLMNYIVKGSDITTYQQGDPAVDQSLIAKELKPDAGAGLFMYNDRWQLGLSVSNLISQNVNLYKSYAYPLDTSKTGIVTLVPHFYGFLSYNFSGNPNYVWQSSLFAEQASGAPLYLAYSLRVHVKEKFYVGLSYRVKDAVALDLGITIRDNFEVCYSYDFITSALSNHNSGTQEITLIWSADHLVKNGHRGDTFDDFQKRKYGYMF